MISKIKNFYNQTGNIDKLTIFFLTLAPITFILGNFSINLFFILISIIFYYEVFVNKEREFFKDPIFWLILFFCISLLVNVIFSLYPINSLPRVLKVILLIGFIFQTKSIIQKHNNVFEKFICAIWSIIFLVLLVDIIYEVIFGVNTIGTITYLPGRIASFFGDELVVGHFILGFTLIILSYVLNLVPNIKKYSLLLIIFLILISFLIGERSNFTKFFIIISIFTLIVIKPSWKFILIFISILILTIFTVVKSEHPVADIYETRYVDQLQQILDKKNLGTYLKSSQYGAHYNGALKIFKEYPIFGIGIKNFRKEISKKKYENKEYLRTLSRWATHPHQIHYEFLSETGLFGYLSFLIFILSSIFLSIKSYLKHKNNFQLSSILFILISLAPMIPTGSFFSTFSSGLFWINYAIMIGYIKK